MTKKINSDFFSRYFNHIKNELDTVSVNSLLDAAKVLKSTPKTNKVIIIGNGGSSSIASHVSVDLTKVAKIRSINFNEADLLTCFSNDYGYDNVFEKAIESYAIKGDILIAISSSGKSKNIINAVKKAKKLKMKIINFSGFSKNNPLNKLGHLNFWINSKAYNIVEISHQTLLLSIVDFIVGKIYYKSS